MNIIKIDFSQRRNIMEALLARKWEVDFWADLNNHLITNAPIPVIKRIRGVLEINQTTKHLHGGKI